VLREGEPAFRRYREDYLNDEAFRGLQMLLIRRPYIGDVIRGTGGLRKMRFADEYRQKGKRSGIRIIYYWWSVGAQFWLFTLYGKEVQSDLSAAQKEALKNMLHAEIKIRNTP
jgi:hypothetical protein